MKYSTEIVIAIDDLADELVARGDISREEGDYLAYALFGDTYCNDCIKSYGLDWDLDVYARDIAALPDEIEDIPNHKRYCEMDYAAQKFLQKKFSNKDSVLIDVSW